jgi:hypothetical protein
MVERVERFAVGAVALFIGVSAVGGGWGLLGGGIRFPLEWLVGTPFADYTIPALILGGVVGGSALVAAALLVAGHPRAPVAAVGAGLVQVGWIVGEVVLVGMEPGPMLTLQVLYFGAGALLAALAGDLRRRATPAGGDRPAGTA